MTTLVTRCVSCPLVRDSFTVLARQAAGIGAAVLLASCGGRRDAPPGADSAAGSEVAYPHAGEPIGTVRESYDGVLTPELAINTFRNIDRLFPTRTISRGPNPRPLPRAERKVTTLSVSDSGRTYDLEAYLTLNRVAAMLVLKDGKVALERYQFGNSERTRWMSMSVAKSITSTLIGAAIHDGRIRSLDDSVTRYVPVLKGSAYEGVSVRDILMMASGVKWDETYTDSTSDRRHLLEAQIAQQPGAAMAVMAKLPKAAEPGTRNNYSTGETQVAGEIVRGAVGKPLAEYLSEKLWQPMGMEADATWWLDSPDGMEIGGSGISATLRDYGRFGQFILEDGVIDGRRVLPEGWVHEAGSPKVLKGGAPLHYGYMWWPSETEAGRRDGAFAAQGIHGQYVYINPAAKVVIVVWGARPHPTQGAAMDDMVVFDAVVEAVR